MGAWGPAIFSDDVACDVRDRYRELLEDQLPDEEAEAQVLAELLPDDPDDIGVVWLALAATQSKLGRLSDATRARALEMIDGGADLARWDEATPADRRKRAQALAKLRDQLTGPQPPRKRLPRPRQQRTGLEVGDVLGVRSHGLVLVVRVARLDEDRRFQCPIVVKLQWVGDRPPTTDELASVPDRPIEPAPLAWDPVWRTTVCCVVPDRGDTWEAAGFDRIDSIGTRAGDDELVPNIYLGFSSLSGDLERAAAALASAS